MSIIPALLSQGCCCAEPEPGGATGRIMSKFGLITECNVGIQPTPNDQLGCVMQSSSWSQITLCLPLTPDDPSLWLGTVAHERDAIVVPYSLASSEVLSGSAHAPNHWIWWTKNRCLELDFYYPGCNACCCSSGEHGYDLFFNSAPVSSPWYGDTLQDCGNYYQGGQCIENAFAEDYDACYLEGLVNPEPLVGTYEQQFVGPLYWWSFNPYYPAATREEHYEAHGTFGAVCNTILQNRSNQGLSTYQVRTAKYRSPDIWEILNFNDGKAIGVMVNSPSSVLRRGRVSYYERHLAVDAYNGQTNAPFYIDDPKDYDAQGAHGLFRYFFAFASEEFSYVKGEVPVTQFLSQGNNASLFSKALPSYFHQVADAVPIFSFQTNYMSCLGAAGEGQENLTFALCEIGHEQSPVYPDRQQIRPPDLLTPESEGWQDQCMAVDAAFRTTEAEDMLACKDWREEIWEDLQTLSVFRTSHDLAWTEMASLDSIYTTAQSLKPVGPVRVRGDYFDMRRINPVTKLVDTTTRPPSLARCQSDSTGVGSEYADPYDSGALTLQVPKNIYDLVSPPSGFYQTATAATTMQEGEQYKIVTVGTTDYTTVGASANTVGVIFIATGTPTGTGTVALFDDAAYFAWQRLTQSVYFRSKPIGWDTSALFQNQVSVALDARFRWLGNRGDAVWSDDSSTAFQSLGTNVAPLTRQPQWCTSGLPQDADLYSTSVPCVQANCDMLGSTVAYEWNSSILVARFAKSHYYNGAYETTCPGYENPAATTGGCCRVTSQGTSGKTLVRCPFGDSNICFARFINRPYQWNDSAVPFRMEPTKLNLIDRNSICCEYPHPLQSVCDTTAAETLSARTRPDATWVDDPINYPDGCIDNDCITVGAFENPCNDGSLCNSRPGVAGGIGAPNCGSQAYAIKAATMGVAFKPGSWFFDDGFNPGYAPRPPCQENFRLNGYIGAPQQHPGGGLRRYPVGHAQNEAVPGTPFLVKSYMSPSLQESECCSIDDRSDQRMGVSSDGAQKKHWVSFPAISITTGP